MGIVHQYGTPIFVHATIGTWYSGKALSFSYSITDMNTNSVISSNTSFVEIATGDYVVSLSLPVGAYTVYVSNPDLWQGTKVVTIEVVDKIATDSLLQSVSTNSLSNSDPRLAYLDTNISSRASSLDIEASPILQSISSDLALIKAIETGTWSIVGQQMLFYDANNIEILRFDLLDKNGNPTSDPGHIYNRVLV